MKNLNQYRYYYLLREENEKLLSRVLPCRDEWKKFCNSRA
jgi:hypothetical protein